MIYKSSDVLIPAMKITLTLDERLAKEIRGYAQKHSLAPRKAIPQLLRTGLPCPTPIRTVNGLEVFDIPRSSHRVISKRVKQLELE